jgi:hypothetical protein
MRNLGFIKRTCSSFMDPIPLRILYCSLVRFQLEYCPLIWLNNTSKQLSTLESIQNNFLHFISFKFNIYRPSHGSYDNVLQYLNLLPLIDQRIFLLSRLFHNLLLCHIDCSNLLSLINLKKKLQYQKSKIILPSTFK